MGYKPQFEEINIGDEVHFDSTRIVTDDLYWVVVGKDEKTQQIFIEHPYRQRDNRWTLKISDVYHHQPK